MPDHNSSRKQILSWALYDWANSAFATTVMAGFFPVFFKNYWSEGTEVTHSTFKLGVANAVASICVAVLAPILGAIADRGGSRKRFLYAFAALGIAMTGALWFVARGAWGTAAILYVLAFVGFAGANVFYDSLLVAVAPADRFDRVSALGYALGYLGGGVLFSFDVWAVLHPEALGMDKATAVRMTFVLVAVWWAVFSIPLLLFVSEPKPSGTRARGFDALRAGLVQLAHTFREVRGLRHVFLFLLAYWLYIDGVDTIVVMAVDYGMSLGFDEDSLIAALLITQFVGFPAAIVFGRVGDKLGARTGILIALATYLAVTVFSYFMDKQAEFYVLAGAIGLVQGGIQALSRSFYARLIPPDKSAEFFGFYNMLGKFAAVLGPLLLGTVGRVTGNPRLGILSICVLFLSGGALLLKVRPPVAEARA